MTTNDIDSANGNVIRRPHMAIVDEESDNEI